MKKLLAACFVMLTSYSIGQYFSNVGPFNTPIHTNVTEIDFVISESGIPYVYYVDGTTQKGNVKYWDGTNWVQYGSADFTLTNLSELKIKVYYDGTDDHVMVASKQAGTAFECYRWDGSIWYPLQYYDDFGPVAIYLNAGFEFDFEFDPSNGSAYLIVGGSGTNNDHYYVIGLSNTLWNELTTYSIPNVGEKVDLELTNGGGHYIVTSRNTVTTLYYDGFGAYANWGDLYGGTTFQSEKVAISTFVNQTGGNVSVGGIKIDNGPDEHDVFHATSDETAIQTQNQRVGPTGVWSTDFDLAAKSTHTYYIDSKGGGIVKRHNHSTGIVDQTLNNLGVAGTKTNLEIELNPNNEQPVIAFIDASGQLWVRELWDGTGIAADDPNLSMCSGTTYDYTDWLTITSTNLDNNEIGVTVTADIPSAVSGSLNGPFPSYDAQFIAPFNPVTQNITLTVETFTEDGNLDNDDQYSMEVKGNDSISSSWALSSVCTNHGLINFSTYLSPTGGVFSSNVTNAGVYDPSQNGGATETVTYTTNNQSGCSNSMNISFGVNTAPNINVTAGNSGCADSTGTASVTVVSGQAPYSYYWTTGADSTDLSGLPAGSYTVTVTDNNGCMATGVANIQNNDVNLTGNVSNLDCSNGSNGAIDLTIAGNGPFDILWSNGYSTEDVTGLSQGTYDVTVEDANGCVSTETFTVSAPAPITVEVSTTNASCGSPDGSAIETAQGGTLPYTIEYFDNQSNSLGTTLNNVASGSYSVVVTDANGCSKTKNFVINENGGPVISLLSNTNASCLNDGAINIDIATSGTITSINWSNGATTEDISNLAAGTYTVTVTDNGGCTSLLEVDVNPALPATPEICVVTVDSVTTKNLVVWEKGAATNISHYNIYREGSVAGVYVKVDSVLYAEDSEFVDHVASPMVRSWRYKLSQVNNCGVESSLSDYHKTIHATISVGLGGNYNIHWDAYEGITYSTWSCWRYTALDGFTEIWNAASNIFSYTDTPPSTQDLDYVIGFPLAQTCSSSLLKAQDYNGTRSNRSAGVFMGSGLGIEDINTTDFDVTVYPNPNSGEFRVHITGIANGNFDYQLIDMTGKLIEKGRTSTRVFDKNFSELEKGVYYMILSNNGVVSTKKIVIQ